MVIESEWINESLHGSIISLNPLSYFCPFPHFSRHAFSSVASAELSNLSKVECVFPMVIVSIWTQAEFGRNKHAEDVPNFIWS